jgi:hypothetical protein
MDTERIEDEILSIASIYEDSFERDIPTVWQVMSSSHLAHVLGNSLLGIETQRTPHVPYHRHTRRPRFTHTRQRQSTCDSPGSIG